jgi:hypothetical protein
VAGTFGARAGQADPSVLRCRPFPAWFSGWDAVAVIHVSLFARDGSFRFVPTRSNGQLAFGIYLRRETGTFVFRHIQVLTVFADGIARIDAFQAKGLAEAFGLPEELPAESRAEHQSRPRSPPTGRLGAGQAGRRDACAWA